jgi:hypothetical protein
MPMGAAMKPLTARPLTAGPFRNTVGLMSMVALLCSCGPGCRKAADTTPPVSAGSQTDTPVRSNAGDVSTAPRHGRGDPANAQSEEMKVLLEGVPASVRKGRTEPELAQELGCRTWVVDYAGGPLSCWLEVEEAGQKTCAPRLPGPEGIAWPCQPKEGRIVMCFRPGASQRNPSARSKRIAERLGPREEVAQLFVLYGAISSKESAADPLQPRWWSAWDDVSLTETRGPAKVPAGKPVALLIVEATEKQPPQGAQPRKVKLSLKAQSAGSK